MLLPSLLLFVLVHSQSANGILINRLTPKADRGFQVELTVIPNEGFWLCFGYVPSNSSHHHSFRWDQCTDERSAFAGTHGFAYTLHASWENQLLNLRFWRAEITDDDYMLVHSAPLPPSNTLTITHSRGITAINDNTIRFSSIVRAIEAPIPLNKGPDRHAGPERSEHLHGYAIDRHKLDTLHVLDKTVEVRGLKDKGVIVIGNGNGIQSMKASSCE
ncbi:hypothetical protein M3Y99_01065900 [Aphelenchoides fujianensis]|nr:hypothetical protein M3Y99_01065900 [Aphelenchoides fujianensis]